jgi:hypothetical protein
MKTVSKTKQSKILLIIIAVFMFCFGLLSLNDADAAEKWKVLGNTIWVSGDSRLTLEMPSVSHPYLKVISNRAGDFQWIEATVPFTLGEAIEGIYLCYQTPDTLTFISQIRLAEYRAPTPATVTYDDPTNLFNVNGDCYFSDVDSYFPNGSVNISLRLNFLNPGDEIWIGALGILIAE